MTEPTEEVKNLIETPPSELSDKQKIQIRYNSYIRKNYCIRWKIKNELNPNINYAFNRGGFMIN